MLFCLGPGNLEPGQPPPQSEPDRIEPLLQDLGFTLPNQTILYNAENEAMAEQRPGMLTLPGDVKIPPSGFDWAPGTGLPRTKKVLKERPPHPIRVSMRLATRGLEKERDLQLRGPGDFFGTRQAGMPTFRLIDLVRDRELLDVAGREAARWFQSAAPPPRTLDRMLQAWADRFRLMEIG